MCIRFLSQSFRSDLGIILDGVQVDFIYREIILDLNVFGKISFNL